MCSESRGRRHEGAPGGSSSRLSVVIPAFNEARELPATLASLKRQTEPSIEIIVVDNASTDETSRIAEEAGVRLIEEPHLGTAHAREAGFRAAGAEIIASTDADARVPADWARRILDAFDDTEDLAALFGPFCYEAGTAPTDFANRLLPAVSWFVRNAIRMTWLCGRTFFAGSNFAVRKDCFSTVDGFRSDATGEMYSAWEDVQLGLKLHEVGDVRYLHDLVVMTSARDLESIWGELTKAARRARKIHLERQSM